MGRPIAVDPMIVIYLLEKNPEFLVRAKNIFNRIKVGHENGIISIIGLIEIQTGAKKLKRFIEAQRYKEVLVNFPNMTIKNINENIVEISSDLRAKYNISTPDAIHLATAIDSNAKKFITNDNRLMRVKEIRVETLKDLKSL